MHKVDRLTKVVRNVTVDSYIKVKIPIFHATLRWFCLCRQTQTPSRATSTLRARMSASSPPEEIILPVSEGPKPGDDLREPVCSKKEVESECSDPDKGDEVCTSIYIRESMSRKFTFSFTLSTISRCLTTLELKNSPRRRWTCNIKLNFVRLWVWECVCRGVSATWKQRPPGSPSLDSVSMCTTSRANLSRGAQQYWKNVRMPVSRRLQLWWMDNDTAAWSRTTSMSPHAS